VGSGILGGIGSIVGGIGSFIGGEETAQADQDEAAAFQTAAQYAELNAYFSAESGGLQNLAEARKMQSVQGTQAAAAGANGLHIAGSVSDIMKDSMSQGFLQQGAIGLQTMINVVGFQGQAASDEGMAQMAQAAASAAQTSGAFGLFGGLLGGIGKIFGL
jgi:hypothetical protein